VGTPRPAAIVRAAMPCIRHELRRADRPRLLAEVVASLRAGELCVLPTETVYGLAALPSQPGAAARLQQAKGRAETQPFTWHVADRAMAARLWRTIPSGVERLLARYWPGPLTVVLPDPHGGSAGARLPAHEFTRAVIAACGEPLWLTSVNLHGEAPLLSAPAIEAAFAAHVAHVVDDGPSPLGTASTIVRRVGPRLEVLREGILTASEVLQTAARLVLFVCTGNTCRSPLAEVIARDLAGKALGVTADDVLAHGVQFLSAGTGSYDGMPASEHGVTAAAELQLDLSRHESRMLTPELIERASFVYCLAQSHRRAILAEMPAAASKVALLRADGLDIADPYGRELPAYRRARDEIAAAVAARLPEWSLGS
jgi:tRNA threonylcarbamoyl adenosine modification protein (Sua5/YciO/YrdC/YwlC family)